MRDLRPFDDVNDALDRGCVFLAQSAVLEVVGDADEGGGDIGGDGAEEGAFGGGV